MAFITQQYTAVTGDTLTAAIWNTEFQNIITTFNGGITNANIQAAAGIEYSKLDLNASVLDSDLAGNIAPTKITNTAVTLTDTQTLENKTLTKPTVNASVHPIESVSYSDPLDFDLDVSNHFFVELTGSPTVTFSNASNGQVWIIHFKQDSTGSRTVTFPVIRWAGGSEPTLTTTGNKIDTLGFIQSGSDIYGYVIGLSI